MRITRPPRRKRSKPVDLRVGDLFIRDINKSLNTRGLSESGDMFVIIARHHQRLCWEVLWLSGRLKDEVNVMGDSFMPELFKHYTRIGRGKITKQ